MIKSARVKSIIELSGTTPGHYYSLILLFCYSFILLLSYCLIEYSRLYLLCVTPFHLISFNSGVFPEYSKHPQTTRHPDTQIPELAVPRFPISSPYQPANFHLIPRLHLHISNIDSNSSKLHVAWMTRILHPLDTS